MEEVTNELLRSYLGDNYQPSDNQLIALYVETYEFYKRMQIELKNMPLMMEHINKAKATNYIKNPLSIELTKAVTMDARFTNMKKVHETYGDSIKTTFENN